MTDLQAALKNGIVVKVVFTKVDGSSRTLIGTTNPSLIPKVDHPRNTGRAESAGVQRIYDLEISEWRSIRLNSIKEWKQTEVEVA